MRGVSFVVSVLLVVWSSLYLLPVLESTLRVLPLPLLIAPDAGVNFVRDTTCISFNVFLGKSYKYPTTFLLRVAT